MLTFPKMVCDALIKPHFDYACPSWYPSLTKKKNKKESINYAK